MRVKLNLGCGEDIRSEYVNCDIRIVRGVDVQLDLEHASLPFRSESADEILLKDALEHVSWRKVDLVLKECFRILKPGGTVIIQAPDLEAIAKKVILNPDFRYGDLYEYKAISFWVYGGQDYPENTHKAGFTIPTLTRLLEEIGFKVNSIENDGGTNLICVASKPR